MSAESATLAGRSAAEARMTDTCRVTKPGTGSPGTMNQTTGQYDAGPADVTLYEGPCRLGRVEIPHVTQATAGEAVWDTQDAVLHLPMDDTESVAPGCTVTYLTSDLNPGLVGRVYGVIGVVSGTNLTARRCMVREAVQV